MAIRFRCPSCGKTMSMRDDAAGKVAKCPACGQRIRVPGSGTAEAKPPAEQAGPAPEPPRLSPQGLLARRLEERRKGRGRRWIGTAMMVIGLLAFVCCLLMPLVMFDTVTGPAALVCAFWLAVAGIGFVVLLTASK